MTSPVKRGAADVIAEHLAQCTGASAAVVVDGNADAIIADLLAAGWTLDERTDCISGKRIRFVRPPAGHALTSPSTPTDPASSSGTSRA
jgi:hypothetical protein